MSLKWLFWLKVGGATLAAVAVCAALGFTKGYFDGKAKQRDHDAPVISGLQTDLATCKATVDQQSAAMAAQNAAIDQLVKEGEQRQAAADQALKRAQAEAQRYRSRAEKIARTPPSSPDMCKAADQLITKTLSEERP